MKGWLAAWSSFPPAHKKRLFQALGAYALLCLAVAAWFSAHREQALQDWQSRIPSASAPIPPAPPPQLTAAPQPPAPGAMASAPEPAGPAKPLIAVVISNLGLSSAVTERALSALPPNVALSFSPYASEVQGWISKALQTGHEALLMMPMESATYPAEDPGPRALSSRLSDQDNGDNLEWLLARGRGAVGISNFMGSRFLADKKRLAPVFALLRQKGAIFIETPEIEKSAAAAAAELAGTPYLKADLQIDASVSDAHIQHQLAALEKLAQDRSYAIGIAQPYPLTLSILAPWASQLEARGFALAPLNTLWKNKSSHAEPAPPSQDTLRKP